MHKVIPSKLKWQKTTYGYFRKIVMQVKNTPNKDCKVQFIWIPPNSTIRGHFHKGQTESEYVLKGSGTITSGKLTIKLKPNVHFIVEKNELHKVKSGKNGLLLFVTKANFSDDTEWRE